MLGDWRVSGRKWMKRDVISMMSERRGEGRRGVWIGLDWISC